MFHHAPFSTDQVFAQLQEKGEICKITLVKHERTFYLEDSDNEGEKEFKLITKTEMQIPKPRKSKKDKKDPGSSFKFSALKSLIGQGNGKDEDSHFITLKGLEGQEFDDLIMQMDVNGRSRTFGYSDPKKNFHPNFILEDVKYKDGNPDYTSFKKECKQFYKDIMKDGGYVVE